MFVNNVIYKEIKIAVHVVFEFRTLKTAYPFVISTQSEFMPKLNPDLFDRDHELTTEKFSLC